jgi:hypothetical protein
MLLASSDAHPAAAHPGRLCHALGLERQLLPVVQRDGVPAGALVERQHARAFAVVLGLGDEPLHEHARASGQKMRTIVFVAAIM